MRQIFSHNKLARDILTTVAYYDALGLALTTFEIWKYLLNSEYFLEQESFRKVSLLEIEQQLQQPEMARFLETQIGCWFLRGENEKVARRIANGKHSLSKIQKLKKIVKVLRLLPFVRMIAVTGGVSLANAKPSSDLDLLIVSKAQKIWTTRILVTGVLHLLGWRRHGKKVRDRACLNYYLVQDKLEIRTKDLFSASEYHFILPLYDDGVYEKFQAANRWIAKTHLNYELNFLGITGCSQKNKAARFVQSGLEKLWGAAWLEKILERLQVAKIARNPKTQKEGALISASAEALIFLPEPKGPRVFEKFKLTLEKLSK